MNQAVNPALVKGDSRPEISGGQNRKVRRVIICWQYKMRDNIIPPEVKIPAPITALIITIAVMPNKW